MTISVSYVSERLGFSGYISLPFVVGDPIDAIDHTPAAQTPAEKKSGCIHMYPFKAFKVISRDY